MVARICPTPVLPDQPAWKAWLRSLTLPAEEEEQEKDEDAAGNRTSDADDENVRSRVACFVRVRLVFKRQVQIRCA
jgi:hypothetical protein